MQRIAKLVKWGSAVVVLLIIGLPLFPGQPAIMMKNLPVPFAQPFFNQFVRPNWPTAGNQGLDQLSALDFQISQSANTNNMNNALTYSAPPLVQPLNAGKEGNMTYAGGHVIDGIANVYLIFWQDPSFQPFTPKYMSLLRRFVTDVGSSPLYAMLSQYTDSKGRSPTSVKLAGTFLDTRPFPQALVKDLNQQNFNPNVMDQAWRQEVRDVAANQGINTKSYHNIFAVLSNTRRPDACGYHSVLSANGSPYLFVSFSSKKGKLVQGCNHSGARVFPNNDPIADVAVSTLSHELIETVTDPQINGWGSTGNNDEIGDKCNQAPYGVNPTTKGNVTWNGHAYLIQREYNNNQRGCTLKGP